MSGMLLMTFGDQPNTSEVPRAEQVAYFQVNSSENFLPVADDIKCLVPW